MHDHVVTFNATYDPVEKKWKAAQIVDIKHDAGFFESIYHNRLASNLKDIGYGIRRKGKSFEIDGISDKLIQKFSRRTATIEATKKMIEEQYGVEMGPEAAAKLGATTRLYKTDTKNFNLNAYWVSRLTGAEKKELRDLQGRKGYEATDAKALEYAIGHLFERQSVVEDRKLYEEAIRHGIGSVTPESVEAEGQRQGVLLKDGLATTRDVLDQERRVVAWAREGRGTCRGMGAEARLGEPPNKTGIMAGMREDVAAGLGFPGQTMEFQSAAAANSDLATSPAPPQPNLLSRLWGPKSVASQNRPDPRTKVTAKSSEPEISELSPQQQAAVRHVWESPDRVVLLRGGAGTGKTTMMRAAIAGIDRPTVVLAPSSDASRGVLRKEGFKDADTLAKFLLDEMFQEQARGGVIWVDEAGQVSMRQLDGLFQIADRLDARVVLQGDKKQHGAIERGATLRVLEEFAGLPVAELTDIRRQKGDYKAAIASIQKGDILAGYDKLASMGWIRQTPVFDHNKPLVDDFMAATEKGKSVLVVAPTHAEGDEITAEIRDRLKATPQRGKDGKIVKDKQPVMRLGSDEKTFDQLVPLAWTAAEKGDPHRYEGSEILQFVRNSGPHRTGERVGAAELLAHGGLPNPGHVAVYSPGRISLAAGDQIRITAGGKSKGRVVDGKLVDQHRLDTGAVYTIKGLRETDDGPDIILSNGWVLDGSKALHVAHAYVSTSHAAQGKTVDRVLVAMGGESRGAINAEQWYVSLSRGRESATVYTNLSPATLREAIQKADTRMTATELMRPEKPKAKRKNRMVEAWKRMQQSYRRMLERYQETKQPTKEREYAYER